MSDDIGALADKLKSMLDNGGADGLLDLIGNGKPEVKKSGSMDIDTIMKFKKAYDSVSSRPDPRSSLLASLKPYMNSRRTAELDRVMGLLNLTKITDIVKAFKEE